MKSLLRTFAAIAALMPSAAIAHPHVWVTVKSELVYGADGTITGIRHAWQFDDMFSTFATQGIESKAKGQFTREELAPLADVNVSSLKEFNYFTIVTADGTKVPLTEPVKGDYWLDYKDSMLTLNFTLPLKEPVKARELNIDIYDPTIFVDFSFVKEKPVALAGAPAACKLAVQRPREMSFSESKALARLPPDAKNTEMAWGAQFANKIKVTCP